MQSSGVLISNESLFILYQSHLERILEKPLQQQNAPLSRRQSNNVNVAEIIENQVRRIYELLITVKYCFYYYYIVLLLRKL